MSLRMMNPVLGKGYHEIEFYFKSSVSNAVFFMLLAYLTLRNKKKKAVLPGETIDIHLNVSGLV